MVDVDAHTGHFPLVDLNLVQVGGRVRNPPRRTPIVLPEVRPKSILKCPLDGLGVGVDADALVPQDLLPPAYIRRYLALVLLERRVVVD